MLGGTTSYARGTTPPATCVVGDAFFNTSAVAGQNWLGCTASNTWTVLGGTTSYARGTSSPPSTCVVGDAFFNTSATPGQNWLGCTATNTWTLLGGTTSYARGATPPATCVSWRCILQHFRDPGSELARLYSHQYTGPLLSGATSYARGITLVQLLVSWRCILQHFCDSPGQNWLGCTAANTWTVLGAPSYLRGTSPPSTCVVGDVFFNTDATAGQNWLGCTAANTWTVLGTPAASLARLLTWQKQATATTLISGGETTIASTVVPGGAIPGGACLRFRAGFQHTTGTASIEYRIRYGGSYLTALAPTTSAQITRLEGFMCNDPGSTTSQQIAAGYILSTSTSSEQMTTMTVNSGVDQLFSLIAVGPRHRRGYAALLHGRGAEVTPLRFFLALAIAAPMFAGSIVRSPSNDGGATCNRASGQPCTFKVTCDSALCTRAESDQYQTALNESGLGDTIQLEAGRTFPATGPYGFQHPYKSNGTGYVTITTTEAARLPEEGTRITPAYNPLLPTIQAAWVNSFAAPAVTFQAGRPHAAEHYRFIGIRFASIPTDLSRGLVSVGTYNGFAQPFTAAAGSTLLTITSLTGEFPWLNQIVQLSSTGTLPAPLQPNTYYTVKSPSSNTSRLQLADVNGAIITITD